jgi:hypothetical protein
MLIDNERACADLLVSRMGFAEYNRDEGFIFVRRCRMKLIHTLLFMLRPDRISEDMALAGRCLKSLEKGSYKTLLVYNQGPLSNEELEDFLRQFQLTCTVIGGAANIGISAGRQGCFQYIWENYPDTEFISELHLDMVLTGCWEDALVEFLRSHEEPVVSAGIVDKSGSLVFLEHPALLLPGEPEEFDSFLMRLRRDRIVRGFTHPCIHKADILREIGGYDLRFLTGKQCFEDDSLLLGYYYYYGTKADWHPKVNYNSVVYHAVAQQRLDLHDSILPNYNGLVAQYGAMGLKNLSRLHQSAWHKRFFGEKYHEITGETGG